MRRGMVIDLEKCIGCRSCVVACKQHNAQPAGTWWNRVVTPGSEFHAVPPVKGREYFLPVHCQHCQNAPCEKVCPVDATYRHTDGSILVDFERCIGCRYCMAACPYGVRQFNWEDPQKSMQDYGYLPGYTFGYPQDYRLNGRLVYTPVRPKGVVEKCNFCVHYLAQGLEPACVRGCPGKARFVGDLDDPDSEVSKMIRDKNGFTLLPEKGTKPSVYYLPPKRKEV
ncbi:MAG: 4Fe-4S dicluster domain-containing protein [Deltaproteobacteria bacterium]|nr:MAG: 4Fe-4S dicluster domain-containing protein [Deltaproteobacteria bacterium]